MQTVDNQYIATFKVLYAEYPQKIGDGFVEIRQWETAGSDQVELVVEHGQMDMLGDVITTCNRDFRLNGNGAHVVVSVF